MENLALRLNSIAVGDSGNGSADVFNSAESINEEFAKLKSKLAQVQTKLDERCTEFAEVITAERQKIVSSAERKLGQLEELEKKQEECAQQRSALETLQAELKAAARNRDALLQQKELLEGDLQHAVTELSQERELMELQQKGAVDAKGNLDEVAKRFQENLALEFRKTSGSKLQIIFRRLDPKNADQPFFFFVKITDGRKYEVTDCQPAVPDLPVLVEKLNSTNDFQSFILAVRRRFRASVQP